MLVSTVSNTMAWLEEKPVLDTFSREVLGINLPKMSLTRTKSEFEDVTVSELGNTIGFFGLGLLLDKGLLSLFKPKTLEGNALKWAHMGQSYGMFGILAAFIWAMPFLRNCFTAWHNRSTEFTQVIGIKKKRDLLKKERSPEVRKQVRRDFRTWLQIMGIGIATSLLAVAGARGLVRSQRSLGRLMTFLYRHTSLPEGRFKNFTGWPALFFWGIPAYGGWIQAARDKYEWKEQVLKFGGFVLGFFVPKLVLTPWFDRPIHRLVQQETGVSLGKSVGIADILGAFGLQVQKHVNLKALTPLQRQVVSLWLGKSLSSFFLSLLLLGVSGPVINRFWTRYRARQAGLLPTGGPSAQRAPDNFMPAFPAFPSSRIVSAPLPTSWQLPAAFALSVPASGPNPQQKAW